MKIFAILIAFIPTIALADEPWIDASVRWPEHVVNRPLIPMPRLPEQVAKDRAAEKAAWLDSKPRCLALMAQYEARFPDECRRWPLKEWWRYHSVQDIEQRRYRTNFDGTEPIFEWGEPVEIRTPYPQGKGPQ